MGASVLSFLARPPSSVKARDLRVSLPHTLADRFRRRPHLHLRCVVPVCRDGATAELHA
jgi:hypothetical protein